MELPCYGRGFPPRPAIQIRLFPPVWLLRFVRLLATRSSRRVCPGYYGHRCETASSARLLQTTPGHQRVWDRCAGCATPDAGPHCVRVAGFYTWTWRSSTGFGTWCSKFAGITSCRPYTWNPSPSVSAGRRTTPGSPCGTAALAHAPAEAAGTLRPPCQIHLFRFVWLVRFVWLLRLVRLVRPFGALWVHGFSLSAFPPDG